MIDICRFCLKDMNLSDKYHEINDEIKNDFINVTNTELILSDSFENLICELCLRSLQLAANLKSVLIKNQEKFFKDYEFDTSKFDDDDSEELTPKRKRNKKAKKTTPKTHQIEEIKIKNEDEDPFRVVIFENLQSLSSFNCLVCNKEFTDQVALDIHQVTHSSEKKFACKESGKTFKRSENSRANIQHHENPKFHCDECGKTYLKKASLNEHVQSTHLQTRTHKCKYCSKSYFKANTLNRHVSSAHMKQKFVCCVKGCKKEFSYKHDCKNHITRKHRHVKDVDAFCLIKQKSEVLSSMDESD